MSASDHFHRDQFHRVLGDLHDRLGIEVQPNRLILPTGQQAFMAAGLLSSSYADHPDAKGYNHSAMFHLPDERGNIHMVDALMNERTGHVAISAATSNHLLTAHSPVEMLEYSNQPQGYMENSRIVQTASPEEFAERLPEFLSRELPMPSPDDLDMNAKTLERLQRRGRGTVLGGSLAVTKPGSVKKWKSGYDLVNREDLPQEPVN